MTLSVKEQISTSIVDKLKSIQRGSMVGTHTYLNSVSYVDRQYFQFEEEQVKNNPMPWIILNCDGEDFSPQPSRRYDNTILYSIVGFVKASKDDPNLDTLMNDLQKDILVAILTDTNLSGLASWITIRQIQTVSEMIWPFGAFVISLEVNYSFIGTNM